MNQCQLNVFIWRPSCLVADSASDTLTVVCPNTPRTLPLAGLAGEYYWMSIWPHYKCVATGNQLGEKGGERGNRTVASWDRNLTSLFFLSSSPPPRLSGDAHVHKRTCVHVHAEYAHAATCTPGLPKQRYIKEEESQCVEPLYSDSAQQYNICLRLNVKTHCTLTSTECVHVCVFLCVCSCSLWCFKI